ncbi:MAG TPA: 50S ribosomal protein L21 [Gemmatimonadota bacterium]|nr:50S ribosomal protein L21 [Gemmatimonadota bacterium]
MYAIFEAKGKQFRATPDQKIRMPSIGAEPGERVTFDTVLLAQKSAGEDVLIGRPALKGASVAVEVLRHGKDEKIIVYKMKRRKGYRRKQGHRQKFTEVKVVDIEFGTGESVKPEKPKKAKKAETAKPQPKSEKPKPEAKAEKPKPEAKTETAKPEPKAEAKPEATTATEDIDVTPAAAELAEAEGIDLSALEGTGKEGRILKGDVEAAIKAREGE